MVHVVGDDAISAELSQDDWEALTEIIIRGFKDGKPVEGMRNGILRSGELLARFFPVEPVDRNELADKLHLID